MCEFFIFRSSDFIFIYTVSWYYDRLFETFKNIMRLWVPEYLGPCFIQVLFTILLSTVTKISNKFYILFQLEVLKAISENKSVKIFTSKEKYARPKSMLKENFKKTEISG